jgi:hypothetical protein
MNKTNYSYFLSWFAFLLKYYINNFDKNESINHRPQRAHAKRPGILFQ